MLEEIGQCLGQTIDHSQVAVRSTDQTSGCTSGIYGISDQLGQWPRSPSPMTSSTDDSHSYPSMFFTFPRANENTPFTGKACILYFLKLCDKYSGLQWRDFICYVWLNYVFFLLRRSNKRPLGLARS